MSKITSPRAALALNHRKQTFKLFTLKAEALGLCTHNQILTSLPFKCLGYKWRLLDRSRKGVSGQM